MDPALHAVGFSLTGEHLFITRYSISIYKQVEIKQQKQQQKYNTQKNPRNLNMGICVTVGNLSKCIGNK